MAATSSRTLTLLSLLQSRRYWPGPELAERLQVSTRTLRRDVDRLRGLGYPVRAARGVDGGYQLAAGAALPPLAVDDEEAVALAVSLQAASANAVAGTAEPALRALAKVVQVMPPRLRRRVDALREVTVAAPWTPEAGGVEPVVLLAAAQACSANEGLVLAYAAADGSRTRRRVEPHRLVTLGRRWYLVAHDLDRQDWRTFRVDRIATAEPDGHRFRPRDLPSPDAAQFVRDRISTAHWGVEVSAVLHCPVEVARERLGGWAHLDEAPGGRCRLSLTTDALDWAALGLGRVGAEISEVRPPELLDLLREWSGRFERAGS